MSTDTRQWHEGKCTSCGKTGAVRVFPDVAAEALCIDCYFTHGKANQAADPAAPTARRPVDHVDDVWRVSVCSFCGKRRRMELRICPECYIQAIDATKHARVRAFARSAREFFSVRLAYAIVFGALIAAVGEVAYGDALAARLQSDSQAWWFWVPLATLKTLPGIVVAALIAHRWKAPEPVVHCPSCGAAFRRMVEPRCMHCGYAPSEQNDGAGETNASPPAAPAKAPAPK